MKDNKVDKTCDANGIYALCRHFQARQEKGRDLTEQELAALNANIEHELTVHHARIDS